MPINDKIGWSQSPDLKKAPKIPIDFFTSIFLFQGLENPHDLAAAEDGTIYVAEIGPNRIVRVHL